jgi:hypothetical protein
MSKCSDIKLKCKKKESRAFEKALAKVHAKYNPQYGPEARRAFVVLSLFEDEEGVSMMLHKCDSKTEEVEDIYEGMKEGGITGYIAMTIMSIMQDVVKEVGQQAIKAKEMFDIIDRIGK